MPKLPHVALLIETSRAYGRGILQGVIRYQRERSPWSIYFQPQGLDDPPPTWLKNWKGDGILARINNRKMAEIISRTGLPAVDMRLAVSGLRMPTIGLDNQAVVRLAFEHLANSGFEQFGFCGLPRKQIHWMDVRLEHFRKMTRAAGYACHVFDADAITSTGSANWEETQERIGRWLRKLPKPIGIMACNDDRGQQVLDACRRVNVLVPDEVAVVGVDNDEILCNLAFPPLSSVNINTEQVGYEAAALLARMMAGRRVTSRSKLLTPLGVVARESTNVLATEDRELAAAIRYLREHACEGLRVSDLVHRLHFSRRELERRMRKLLGRTPKEEMLRVQVERAKHLLKSTDLTAASVAIKCGFNEAKYFSQVFRARVGLAPGAYRKSKN